MRTKRDEAYIDSSTSPAKLAAINIANDSSASSATEFNTRITTWKRLVSEETLIAGTTYNDDEVSVEII